MVGLFDDFGEEKGGCEVQGEANEFVGHVRKGNQLGFGEKEESGAENVGDKTEKESEGNEGEELFPRQVVQGR